MYNDQQSVQLAPEFFAATPPQPPPAGRPRWLSASLAQGVLLGVVGVVLAVGGRSGERNNPTGAIRRWHQAMQHGDIALLKSDSQLNFQAWTRAEIRQLGEVDYNRVLGLFTRARELGQTEYSRLLDAISTGGVRQFNSLPYERQQAIARQSHDLWVYEHGFPAVSEAAAVGTWQVLATDPVPPALLQRLGTPALEADEQALLAGRAANDPAVTADPMLVELATRRAAEGQQVIDRLRRQVVSEGERAYRHQPSNERDRIDQRSRTRYVLEHGFASLSETDRARVGTPDTMLDNSDALTVRLGVQQLSPAEQLEINGRTREAFVEGRQQFIENRGTRLAHDALVAEFGTSRYRLDVLHVSGVGGRDLIRRQTARALLSWPQIGNRLRSRPAVVTLRWSSREAEWRIDDVLWRPAEAEPADEPATATPSRSEEHATEETDADGGVP